MNEKNNMKLYKDNFSEANPEELKKQALEILNSVFQSDSNRERNIQILLQRFGLDGNNPRSHKEIAEEFGLTVKEVQDIEAKWFKALRKKVY